MPTLAQSFVFAVHHQVAVAGVEVAAGQVAPAEATNRTQSAISRAPTSQKGAERSFAFDLNLAMQ